MSSYPFRPDVGQSDGGKAHHGVRSMHMGRHLRSTSTLYDTLSLRQVSAFVLDSRGDPDIPGMVFGPASTLEFWHMISVPTTRTSGRGSSRPEPPSGEGRDTMFQSPPVIPWPDLRFYLARAQNGCPGTSTGSIGAASDGTLRTGRTCTP